jgi:tripartite-type tricarboxylate transporter receptor subunit TctC
MRRRTFLAASAALAARPVFAQATWPDKPLKIVVGFAPGSGNDVMARLIATKMAEGLGQPVVVENKPGAGGVVGTDLVAKAPADGLTIGLGTSSQLVMNPALLPSLPFDVERDLAMVGLIARTPLALIVKKDLAAADLKALIARAKAEPGKLSYGSAGNGSITHIVGEHFRREAGIDLVHVPYRGNAPALTDVAGGQIDMLFDGFITAGAMMKAGRVRALGVFGRRDPAHPDVPTFAEAGLPNFEAYTWNGLFVPAGTPAPAVARLNAELNKALKDPEIARRLERFGAEAIGGGTPAEADAFARGQRARWIPAVRAMGIKLQ